MPRAAPAPCQIPALTILVLGRCTQPRPLVLHQLRSTLDVAKELGLSTATCKLLPEMSPKVLEALLGVLARRYDPAAALVPTALAPKAMVALFEDWWQHRWAAVEVVMEFAEQQGSKGGWGPQPASGPQLCTIA
jgi:hypothetical protein